MGDPITLIGNIAMEPERRQTANGLTVATFRIACSSRRFDNETNSWSTTSTNWYTIYAYRALAENVLDSLHKGDGVVVSGKLKIRAWEKDGKRGTAVEVAADSIGQDLRWGTTAFTKVERHSAGNTSRDTWAMNDDSPASGSSWAVTEVGTPSSEDSADPAVASEEPELASTPF